MLYYLLSPFHAVVGGHVSVLNVTRYITFRTAAASLTALALSLLLGPWLIRKLRAFQVGQVIRQEGPTSHRAKAGTPTMGGLLVNFSLLISVLLWCDLGNPFVKVSVLVMLGFSLIGFADDYIKIQPGSRYTSEMTISGTELDTLMSNPTVKKELLEATDWDQVREIRKRNEN